jgi:HrpA-like RNA helicase
VASLPLDVRLGKFIILSYFLDVLDEAVIIAAGLSNKSIFTTPMEKKVE